MPATFVSKYGEILRKEIQLEFRGPRNSAVADKRREGLLLRCYACGNSHGWEASGRYTSSVGVSQTRPSHAFSSVGLRLRRRELTEIDCPVFRTMRGLSSEVDLIKKRRHVRNVTFDTRLHAANIEPRRLPTATESRSSFCKLRFRISVSISA